MFDFVTEGTASPSGDRVFLLARTTTSGYDFLTIALSSSGAVLWERRLTGGTYPASATVTPDGGTLVVAGQRGTEGDLVLVAYDTATGTEKWVAAYDGGSYDWALDVVASPDGRELYATGVTNGPGGPNDVDYLTVSVDGATGAVLWATRSGGPNLANDNPFAIDVSPDGETVAVTGWWQSGFAGPNPVTYYGTIAYDARDGEDTVGGRVRWIGTFRSPGTNNNGGYDLEFSPDSSRLYVTGHAQRPFIAEVRTDYGTVAYDVETGAELWADLYDGACALCVTGSLTVGPDDSVYVTGEVLPAGGGDFDFATVAYSGSTGQRRWTNVYDSLDLHQIVADVAISPNGRHLYVAGMSQFNNTNQLTTIAIDTDTGSTVWDARYGPPSVGATTFNPQRPVLAAAPGRVYVATTSGPGRATDLFLTVYDDSTP